MTDYFMRNYPEIIRFGFFLQGNIYRLVLKGFLLEKLTVEFHHLLRLGERRVKLNVKLLVISRKWES